MLLILLLCYSVCIMNAHFWKYDHYGLVSCYKCRWASHVPITGLVWCWIISDIYCLVLQWGCMAGNIFTYTVHETVDFNLAVCCVPSAVVACEPPLSSIDSIPVCLIRPIPLCLMTIKEQSLDQDGSLPPNPTCSSTLCSPPAVGGAASWCAP